MENLGLVSVIVPIYRVEKQLARCVDCLRNQTYPFLELILVDDGSPDRCGEICDQYAALDERVKVIHKTNAGLGMARNSGLDCAAGDFVVFVDSDDYVKDTYVEVLVRAICENGADLASVGFIRQLEDGTQIQNPIAEQIQVFRGEQVIDKMLLPVIGALPEYPSDVEREMSVWLNMYRKDQIDRLKLRFYSEREIVSEDILFNMEYFFHAGSAVVLPDCLYYYSENTASLTHTYRADRFEKYGKMLQMQKELLEERGLFEKAKLRLYRTFIMKTKKCIALLACSDKSIREKRQECSRILQSRLLTGILKEYKPHVRSGNQKIQMFLLEHRLTGSLLAYYWFKMRKKGS